MSFDDPFKDIRDLTRPFDSFRELTKSPLDEMNEMFEQHKLAISIPDYEIPQILENATTYRSLAHELLDTDTFPRYDSPLPETLTTQQLEVARAWEEQKRFYDGLVPADLTGQILESSGLREALVSVRGRMAEQSPLSALQEAIQANVGSSLGLQASLPALQLEQHLGELSAAIELPGVSSEIAKLNETLAASMPENVLSSEVLTSVSALAGSIDLPYFQAAASQWASMAAGASVGDLSAEPLLSAAIASIVSAAKARSQEDLDGALSAWQDLAEEESQKHGAGEIPAWVQGFLLNLLFFIFSQMSQGPINSEFREKLTQLQQGQASIADAVESDQASRREDDNDSEMELAAIRQQLESLADLVEETKELVEHDEEAETVLYASCPLNLRPLPTDAEAPIWLIPKGTPVEVVDHRGEWSNVKIRDFASGYLRTGWAASKYLVDWEAHQDSNAAANPRIESDG